MGIFIAFAAGLGNFSSRRGKMEEVIHEINQRLALLSTPTRVIEGHHTIGNFVVRTPKYNPREIADELSLALGTPCTVLTVDEATSVASIAEKAKMPAPEPGAQWTKGIAFELRGRPIMNELKPAPHAAFFRINRYAVGVYKKDQSAGSEASTKEDSAGGWGEISAHITEQAGGQWTTRSLARVNGILEKARKHRD